jgi:NAD(P)-dependent dehydrogenase (short-subunit alcohol dehydrogenase family)
MVHFDSVRHMRVLITGAGRAIGAATATELAHAGHEVIATARDETLLEQLDVARRLKLDVTDGASVEAALREAGDLDAIVNNAADHGIGTLEDYPLERLRAMIETNAVAPLGLVKAVLPAWRARGSGVVVNVSSVQGRVSTPLDGAYSASKFALEALSEALHYEVGHFGIRVVIVEPGYIAPGMKPLDPVPRSDAYRELFEQWEGSASSDKVTGPGGRPGPELVAVAIRRAIEDPETPLRVPVGEAAEMILAARAQLDDEAFEAAMRQTLGLTW